MGGKPELRGGRRDFSEHGERRELRGQGATAVLRCLSPPKGALRFRRLHPTLTLGVCLVSPLVVSRPAALGVSSHYRRLLLHTCIFEGEASSCSANHGSGGEGCLVRPGMSQPHVPRRLLQEGRDGAEEEEGITHVYCALASSIISARGARMASKR